MHILTSPIRQFGTFSAAQHSVNSCNACGTPLPENETFQAGWLVGALCRNANKKTSPVKLEICACPAHHAYVVQRQLVLAGPTREPKVVSSRPTATACYGCLKPKFTEKLRGWAIVWLQRLRGVDETRLTLDLCPDCSLEVR